MANVKYNFTMSFDDIRKGSKSCGNRASNVKRDVHKLMVSTLNRWMETGDVSVPCQVAAQILSDQDKHYAQGIVNWFAVHAGFEMVKGDDGEKSFNYDPNKTKITKDEVVAAKDETFEDLSPPKEAKAFDLDARIKTLIKLADNRRAKGLTEKDSVPSEHLEALKAIVS